MSQWKDKNTKTQKKIDKKGGWWEKNKAKIKAAEAKFVMSGLTPMKVAQLDGFIRGRTGAAPKGKNKAEKLVEARGLRAAPLLLPVTPTKVGTVALVESAVWASSKAQHQCS